MASSGQSNMIIADIKIVKADGVLFRPHFFSSLDPIDINSIKKIYSVCADHLISLSEMHPTAGYGLSPIIYHLFRRIPLLIDIVINTIFITM